MNLQFPPDMAPHIKEVLNGEYEINVSNFKPGVILDIGANVGAFTTWAKFTYPTAKIYAYEPIPSTYLYLVKNCAALKDVELFNVAVTDEVIDHMFVGKHNIGEASLYDIGGQGSEKVKIKTLSPSILPECDYLKVDTEGSEINIIIPYLAKHKPTIIAFEFHSEADRKFLQQHLEEFGYGLIGGEILSLDRGTLKFVKHAALAKKA